jgi:hypothetical protein
VGPVAYAHVSIYPSFPPYIYLCPHPAAPCIDPYRIIFCSSFSSSCSKKETMSGVWVFEDGIVRRADSDPPSGAGAGGSRPNKVLVHVPSGEVVTSYDVLERRLRELGWERYLYDPCLLQFHQRSTVHLITVPRDFSRLKLVHMYDVVVKTRNVFEVRDAAPA